MVGAVSLQELVLSIGNFLQGIWLLFQDSFLQFKVRLIGNCWGQKWVWDDFLKMYAGAVSSSCLSKDYTASVSPNTPLDVRMSVFGRCWVTTIFHNTFSAPWHRFSKFLDFYRPFGNSVCREDWVGIDMPLKTYIIQHTYIQTILSSLFCSWDMTRKPRGEWRSQRGPGQRITALSSVKFFPWQL